MKVVETNGVTKPLGLVALKSVLVRGEAGPGARKNGTTLGHTAVDLVVRKSVPVRGKTGPGARKNGATLSHIVVAVDLVAFESISDQSESAVGVSKKGRRLGSARTFL